MNELELHVADEIRRRGPVPFSEVMDLALYDPAAPAETVTTGGASKSRNSPFAGMELPGRVVATFLRGVPTVLDGKLA